MILVTGGAGFIGSHIVDLLIQRGHEVLVLDNLSSGEMRNLNPKAHFVKGDINNLKDIEKLFEKYNIEGISHQAAQISVPVSMKNPQLDVHTNIIGTLNLLTLGQKNGLKRFAFASSAAIYGNPQYLPIDESHPKNPLSFYGLSKLTAESCIKIICENNGINYAILRYANVYGPRQKDEGEGGVVAVFANRMVDNKDCYIFGDGKQTRDFVFVKDIAMANVLALEGKNDIVSNVSTAIYTDINDLFSKMKDLIGYEKNAIYGPPREADIKDSYMKNDDIHKLLMWDAKYDLDRGLRETVDYFKNEKTSKKT